jgi:hypothetical protein
LAPAVENTVLFSGTASYTVSTTTIDTDANGVIFDDPNMNLTAGIGANLNWAGGVFVNAGTIALDAPRIAFGGGGTGPGVGEIVIGNGTIVGDVAQISSQSVLFSTDSGDSQTPGTIYFTNGGTGVIDAQGGAGGSVLEVGAVAAAGTTYFDENGIQQTAGAGNFAIESGATLQFDDTVGSGTKVTFNGPGAVLSEAQLAVVTGYLGDSPTLPNDIALSGMDISSAVGTVSDSIEFVGDTVTANLSGDGTTLRVTDGSETTTYNLTGGSYAGDYALVTTDGSNSFVYLDSVCFASGTHIQMAYGNRAVEALKEGDLVAVSHDGEIRFEPVKWIGYRTLDLTKQPRRRQSAPIRIARGALGDNLPERELTLSPDHCLFLDGKLVPAKLLINDMTVRQDLDVRSVTYYHVELERHSILLAEGVAAESYLDTGNRAFFSNAGLALILHPEFHVNAGLRCWETDACAPLAVSPAAVQPVWRQLADRAVALGHVPPTRATTTEADVHLLADGRRIDTISVAGKVHSFMIPAGVISLVLASRATAPSTLAAYHDDPRPLGVAVSRVTLRGQAGREEFAADHPALAQGWFGPEQVDRALWRWTNGHAALPTGVVSGPVIVEITLASTTTYLIDGAPVEGRLAA